jgi:UDP-GlcNAc:undecaprenyl-phosphate GlcNAc-1-phosphate transferase
VLGVPLLVAPLAAFVIGLCAVPAIGRIALVCGFLDNPDRCRKLHTAPIALGGGIAVWLATWSGWRISLLQFSPETRGGGDAGWFFTALALATFLILVLGIIDDRFGLRGRHKLAGQIVAAGVLVSLGLKIDAWSSFGAHFEPGILAYSLTVLWIVLIINAVNLIDGMDGFCGSVSLIASLAIAFIAYRWGRLEDAMVALALAGALAAFLIFNLPPARIYLGDAGSMTIGMMLSALSVRSCTVGPRSDVLLMPVIALLMLPVLDVFVAVGRRRLKGRSIFTPDRGHIYDCLKSRLSSKSAALGVGALLATVGAGAATLATTYRMGDSVPFLAFAFCVGLLVCTNTFGATESRLLLFRIRVVLSPLWTAIDPRARGVGQECHLLGKRAWGEVWGALVREGEASGVWRIELGIDMTASGEVYQGHWSLPETAQREPHWSISHNLCAGDVVVGMIRVSGAVDAGGSLCLSRVERLVRIVEGRMMADSAALSPSEASSLSHMNLSVNSAVNGDLSAPWAEA